ncbi:hypothetical protein H6P81_011465 [Aristolochia fimbriata]|uniref:Uncharacterized protein n=1 Tax=Aristolochia fimbriata TaxID=158543 RepID=A0AAV7ERL0_ARIFI|nr:hypothetical protein H6P81_011465 [Aristolochia fimbriata]
MHKDMFPFYPAWEPGFMNQVKIRSANMSIDALAMSGADYVECDIHFDVYFDGRSDLEEIPAYLISDHQERSEEEDDEDSVRRREMLYITS